jgi:hypothetical protein
MSGGATQRRALAFQALEERGLSSGDIRRLLDHPRNELLTMEGSRFHYVPPQGGTWVPLKGLTSLLREFYWPDHKPWGKKRKRESDDFEVIWPPPPPRPRKKPRTDAQTTGWTPPILTAKGGVQGSIVHRQLAEYVNLGRDAFLAQNRHVHPLTRLALGALSKNGLYPLVAEYRVACVDVRLGTAIDLLCVNMNTGRPTWIEVKTAARLSAFEGGAEDAFSGRLASINAAQKGVLPVSDCSRARVQLGISVIMGVEGTGYKAGFDAFVLLLANDQREGKLYPVNEAFLQTFAVPLYLDIQKRLPEWRKSRQR